MKYKLLCLDLDGTLLDPEGNVSAENVNAVKKVYEQGIIIAIATGRRSVSAEEYLECIGVDGMIIAANGACIKKKGSTESIFRSFLSRDEIRSIYETAVQYRVKANFNRVHDSIMCHRDNNWYQEQQAWLKEEFLKVSFINDNNDCSFSKARAAIEKLGQFEVVTSEVNYVDIMSKGCSKGSGVERLAHILGIKREEIVCIGDHENDISMIRYAGVGVAMGNGYALLKEAADFVTDSNAHSGVAKAIHAIILNDCKDRVVRERQ